MALPAVLLTILAILTFRQSATYRNSETLYRATLARNPQSWMAHNNLGVDLLARGKTREAIAEYLAALRIKPDDAAAHNNLGNALARNSAHLPQAIAEFQTALRIEPNMAQAHKIWATPWRKSPATSPKLSPNSKPRSALSPTCRTFTTISASS